MKSRGRQEVSEKWKALKIRRKQHKKEEVESYNKKKWKKSIVKNEGQNSLNERLSCRTTVTISWWWWWSFWAWVTFFCVVPVWWLSCDDRKLFSCHREFYSIINFCLVFRKSLPFATIIMFWIESISSKTFSHRFQRLKRHSHQHQH
jgi:hypothetical protein